jgi:hypothetical protein
MLGLLLTNPNAIVFDVLPAHSDDSTAPLTSQCALQREARSQRQLIVC